MPTAIVTPKPLCIELFCGMFGWSAGWLALGGRAVGFDIEHLPHHGPVPAGAELVLQDVLTLHGCQFKDAALILASPPCQRYSYMDMPWGEAKREIAWQEWERDSPFGDFHLNDLFDACFRIQREASAAAGHYIPMVVENVKGAQRWVGRAAWHHGSFYLWGDVPALMPFTAAVAHLKLDGVKVGGIKLREVGFNVAAAQRYRDGIKQGGSGAAWLDKALDERRKAAGTISPCRLYGSRSNSRKAASAQIAKIPAELSEWVARAYYPTAASSSDFASS